MPERTDDPTIGEDELLLRRVAPNINWINKKDNEYVFTSLVFLDSAGEISIDFGSLTTAEDLVGRWLGSSVVGVEAGYVRRECGCIVVRAPTPEDPAHGLICTPPGLSQNALGRYARKIKAGARWILLNTEPLR